jgi:hypothetical protein
MLAVSKASTKEMACSNAEGMASSGSTNVF